MDKIAQILQITPSNNIGTYLGCINIGSPKRKRQDFDDLKKRIRQELAGWLAIS